MSTEPKLIKRNIPIFGLEKYSFLELLRQYSNMKAAYDGAIYQYGQGTYRSRDLNGAIGTVPVRNQLGLSEIRDLFDILENTDEALGFEFEIPLRKNFEADIFVELWPWDYSERLASTTLTNVSYREMPDNTKVRSEAHKDLFIIDPERDEYVFVTVVLNKEKDSDFDKKETYLQSKIKRIFRDPNRDLLARRLFLLRVQLMVRNPKKTTDIEKLASFECRDDSVIIELTE
jgi:hypothetical protein